MSHDDDHHGLVRDLETIASRASRRDILRWLAGAGAVSLGAPLLAPLTGCTDDGTGDSTADANPSSCSVIPAETGGPYPGDGTNGANALALAGIVRGDIRTSIAGATGTADGIVLTVVLTLVNNSASCTPLAGHAVYLWHCDREGLYSLYSPGVTDQNYLRGVQETDANGTVTFTTTFPGCYDGRMPHIHFEIFPSLAAATNGANAERTSQLGLPVATCNEVYATAGYSQSVTNLSRVTFASDNVFRDGTSLQIPAMSGDVTAGYVARLNIAIAV